MVEVRTSWFEKLARFGCLTKGLVYFLLGLLCFRLAFGISSETADSRGALRLIAIQPLGKPILLVVAGGLFCYAFWRLFEAFSPYGFEFKKKKIFKRISYICSGISYGGSALTALKIILNLDEDDLDSTADLTARLMYQPFGQFLIGCIGTGVIGVGSFFFYRAFNKKLSYESNLKEDKNSKYLTVTTAISKFGFTARGVIFILIGFFLIESARQFNPETAAGLDQILELIARQRQGKILLSVIGLGLISYSFHMFIEAKYRDFSRLRKKAADFIAVDEI